MVFVFCTIAANIDIFHLLVVLVSGLSPLSERSPNYCTYMTAVKNTRSVRAAGP